MNPQDEQLNSLIDGRAKRIIQDYLQSSGFIERKLTDNPTDSLQIVNRRYVNLNGDSASRPRGSVLGQQYFDTDLSLPIWWNGTNFQDAAGNPV